MAVRSSKVESETVEREGLEVEVAVTAGTPRGDTASRISSVEVPKRLYIT
jgi:hypothetical protein